MKKIFLKIIIVIIASVFMYLIKGQLLDSGLDAALRIVGMIVAVLAILFLIMEERMNLPFFAGRSQSAGSNANASVVVGLAIALIAQSWLELMLGSLIGIVLVLFVSIIAKKKVA